MIYYYYFFFFLLYQSLFTTTIFSSFIRWPSSPIIKYSFLSFSFIYLLRFYSLIYFIRARVACLGPSGWRLDMNNCVCLLLNISPTDEMKGNVNGFCETGSNITFMNFQWYKVLEIKLNLCVFFFFLLIFINFVKDDLKKGFVTFVIKEI